MRNERRLRAASTELHWVAQAYRQEMTVAEQALWERLRDRRLAGLKFRRQHALLGFVLDFYCPAANLAIELNGPVHAEPTQRQRDADRSEQLCARGVRVLRFSNEQALNGMEPVLATIVSACLIATEQHTSCSDSPNSHASEQCQGCQTPSHLSTHPALSMAGSARRSPSGARRIAPSLPFARDRLGSQS